MKKLLFILSMFCFIASIYSCTDASASVISPKKEKTDKEVSKRYAEISNLTVDSFMQPPFTWSTSDFNFVHDSIILSTINHKKYLTTSLSACRMIIPEKNFNELCKNYIRFVKIAAKNKITFYKAVVDSWWRVPVEQEYDNSTETSERLIKYMPDIVIAIGPTEILNPVSVDPILAVKVDAGYVILTQW